MSSPKYTIFNIQKENHLKLSQICSHWLFSQKLKKVFETAVVNEPPVFEPLKFYCIFYSILSNNLGRPWGITYDFATITFYLNKNQKFWCNAYVNSFIIIKSVLQIRGENEDS